MCTWSAKLINVANAGRCSQQQPNSGIINVNTVAINLSPVQYVCDSSPERIISKFICVFIISKLVQHLDHLLDRRLVLDRMVSTSACEHYGSPILLGWVQDGTLLYQLKAHFAKMHSIWLFTIDTLAIF